MKEKFEERRLSGNIRLTLSSERKLPGTDERSKVWSIEKPVLCKNIVSIVNRYANQGYTLTLRQLYYQLVAGDVIPNDDVVYKKLSGVLGDLRYCGLIDWDAIEDRGRVPYLPYWAQSVPDALNDIARSFRLDRQKGQPKNVEIWTEKDAVSGILRRVTVQYHIRLVVNKGYSSDSAMYSAYQRFFEAINAGQKVVILYFGDHDPSGLDMVRDIRQRILFFLAAGDRIKIDHDKFEREMRQFTFFDLIQSGFLDEKTADRFHESRQKGNEVSDEDADKIVVACRMLYISENFFQVIPVGLTMEQIEQYNPPPNPAKITDPRAKDYISEHGGVSWEVDALPPDIMTDILDEAILANLDIDIFNEVVEKEKRGIEHIKKFATSYKSDDDIKK